MIRVISGLLFTLVLSAMSSICAADSPEVHPCTGDKIPLSTEKAVVSAIECLYDAKVAKVEKVTQGGQWLYRLRLLTPSGRVKTVDVDPQTGMPTDPKELEAFK